MLVLIRTRPFDVENLVRKTLGVPLLLRDENSRFASGNTLHSDSMDFGRRFPAFHLGLGKGSVEVIECITNMHSRVWITDEIWPFYRAGIRDFIAGRSMKTVTTHYLSTSPQTPLTSPQKSMMRQLPVVKSVIQQQNIVLGSVKNGDHADKHAIKKTRRGHYSSMMEELEPIVVDELS